MTEEKIKALLNSIEDPDSGAAFLQSNIVRNLRVDKNTVHLELALRDMNVAFKAPLHEEIHTRILAEYPSASIDIHFHQLEPKEKSTRILPQVTNIIAVGSGKGGVGKSTVSTEIAKELHSRGFRTGILDADLYGPSVPLLMGLQGRKPKVKKYMGMNKILPIVKDGIPVMSIGFVIQAEQAVVMRGPRLGGIIKQFIHETHWPELDFLIIDLPPGTGDVHLTLVQTIPITGALMVTLPDELAVADAVKAMNMFLLPNVNVPVLGVVENMSWFTPFGKKDEKYRLFGEGGGARLAQIGKTKLIHQSPFLKALAPSEKEAIDRQIKENYTTLVDALIEQINWRRSQYEETKVVQMNTN